MPDATMHDVDVNRDSENCGRCGNRCGRLEVCARGACAYLTGFTKCPAAGTTGGVCVDLETSNFNCGECGNVCPRGTVCRNGTKCETPSTTVALRPETCAEMASPSEPGVSTTLYVGNFSEQGFTAYCDDLTTGPTTWLELTGAVENFTYLPPYGTGPRHVAGSAGPGMPGLRSTFTRVRFVGRPTRLLLQDNPTAEHVGWRLEDDVLRRSADLGLPFGCRDDVASASSMALTTSLAIASEWSAVGMIGARGTSSFPAVRRSVALTSQGCGGFFPDGVFTPYRPMYVRLAYQR